MKRHVLRVIALTCALVLALSQAVCADPIPDDPAPASDAAVDEDAAPEEPAADPAVEAGEIILKDDPDSPEAGPAGDDAAEGIDEDVPPSDEAEPAAEPAPGAVEEAPATSADPASESPNSDDVLTEESQSQPLNGLTFDVVDDPDDPSYTLQYWVLPNQDQCVEVYVKVDSSKTDVEIVIPETVSYEGVDYTVTMVDHIYPQTAALIKSISFPDTVREITGNLIDWFKNSSAETEGSLGIPSRIPERTVTATPDTEKTLAAIPDFISHSYDEYGCYYAGKCLVRVDPDHEGDVVVRDGTICVLAGALEGCSGIKKVTLPDSLEFIGMHAFANSSVTEVNLPKNLTKALANRINDGRAVSMGAFFNCQELTTVTIEAETLGSIGPQTFYNCCSLKSFDFSKVSGIECYAFARAFAKGTKVTVGSNVAFNGGNISCFAGSGMSELEIDSGFTPYCSFMGCPNLKKVTVGEHLTNIDDNAFEGCAALANDVLAGPDVHVNRIGFRAFARTGMKEFTVPASWNDWNGADILAENPSLETLNWYPEDIKSYGFFFNMLNHGSSNCVFPNNDMFAFTPLEGGTNIKTLNLYGGVEKIQYNQSFFMAISTVEKINIKYPVKTIPDYFAFCDINLKKVTLDYPEALESVGKFAFACSGLEQAVILKNVTYGEFAFWRCERLKKVVVEEGVTDFNKFMFHDCPALKQISLPESLRVIKQAAFKNTGSGVSFYLNSQFERIEDDAFTVTDGRDHGVTLIMAGDPQIQEESTQYFLSPNSLPIPASVKVFTANGPNYQAYKELLTSGASGEDIQVPEEAPLPGDRVKISYSGGVIRLGSKFDQSKLKVTVNSKTVPKSDYTIAFDRALTKPGLHEGTVKLDPEKYSGDYLQSRSIAARLMYGADKEGPVYSVKEGEDLTFDLQVSRFVSAAGKNRYSTAAAIAKEAFPKAPSEAVLVTGEKFPDALAANAYAGAKNAPVLITKLSRLSDPTRELLTKTWGKKVKTVTIIGGGFDKSVETALKSCGVTTIKHIAGKNRYETAEKICEAGIKEGLFDTGGPVVVATGETAADALSVSPYSYKLHMPILLVKGGAASASTKKLIARFGICIMLGASETVKDTCLSAAQKSGGSYIRLAGSNRYKTSLAVAAYFIGQGVGSYDKAAFADGTDEHFPDALIGGMLQGQFSSPIILTKPGQGDVNKFIDDTLGVPAREKEIYYFLGYDAKGRGPGYAEITGILGDYNGPAVELT